MQISLHDPNIQKDVETLSKAPSIRQMAPEFLNKNPLEILKWTKENLTEGHKVCYKSQLQSEAFSTSPLWIHVAAALAIVYVNKRRFDLGDCDWSSFRAGF